ncbi:MAG: rnhA operon protein [Haloarculaceae archaeon]
MTPDTVPETVRVEAERLTRRARAAVDDREAAAYREEREQLLAEHGYTARVREEDRAVLVLHPTEWMDDGTVRPDRIDDIDRGVEIPLEGPGEDAEWEAVAAHNREVAATVREEHGPVHGANAEALADFCNNHYAKPVEDLSPAEREEFLTEYYRRNVWPSDEQKAVVEESVALAVEAASTGQPR